MFLKRNINKYAQLNSMIFSIPTQLLSISSLMHPHRTNNNLLGQPSIATYMHRF
jgi:hypothetical protein